MGVRTDSYGSVSVITDLLGHTETGGQKSLAVISIDRLVALIGAALGDDYRTLADLQADLGWVEGSVAKVWGDPVPANRGVYQKSGEVGAGAWMRIGPIPETDLSHSLRVPTGEFINPFPDAATRAGTVVMFDAVDGQPTTGPTAAEIGAAEGHAQNAATDRALADAAATAAASDAADAAQSAIDAANTVLGNAASIAVTPAGSMTSENVQDALEELDTDIQGKADLSAIGAELPVGSTMLWMSDAAPSAFWVVVKTENQTFSRSTYHMLFDHYAPERTVVITSGSAVVTGIGSDQDLAPGMDVEGAEIPAGTTILSVDGPSQVTLSANATANGTTCRVFRYGNGDGATTCNFPPFAGRYFRFGDPGGTINPDAAGAMGILQEDQGQGHWHARYVGSLTATGAGGGIFTAEYASQVNGGLVVDINGNSPVREAVSDGVNGTPRTGSETRPKTIIGYIAVKVSDGVDDPVLITAANVIQDLTNVVSKANANEADIATLQSQLLGVGQTLQDLTGSRFVNTDYQNTTGRPISVFIRWGTAGGVPFEASADGVNWRTFGTSNGTAGTSVSGIVPDGFFYRVGGAISISAWTELR
ncbi:hypothetical protein ABVF61_00405 [Roseibium sp. HPY-6]|uniref:hypothetical protein n=1 Tax=Roseibium sp. HPY-6 TaxID=3229852 RepID=UPI00338F64BC